MDHRTTNLALGGSLAAPLSLLATAASAQDAAKEKCYGVALKAQNDCAPAPEPPVPGTSKVDYQGNSWKLVPKGTCTTMAEAPNGSLTIRDHQREFNILNGDPRF